MFYYAAKIIWVLIQPSNLLLLMIVGGVLARALGHHLVANWLTGSAALILATVSLLPVGQWLLLPLEDRFPRPDPPPSMDGVVVLSGGADAAVTYHRGVAALGDTAERFTAMIELGRRYPEARLIFTGGPAWAQSVPFTERDVMRAFCRDQQFACERIEYEEEARNTHENALFAKTLAEPRPGERWLLVTSAAHMPRSIGVFRRAGWEVLPYPVDYRTAPGPILVVPDVSKRLVEFDLAVQHWVGLLAYRLTGRTDTLFPGP